MVIILKVIPSIAEPAKMDTFATVIRLPLRHAASQNFAEVAKPQTPIAVMAPTLTLWASAFNATKAATVSGVRLLGSAMPAISAMRARKPLCPTPSATRVSIALMVHPQ